MHTRKMDAGFRLSGTSEVKKITSFVSPRVSSVSPSQASGLSRLLVFVSTRADQTLLTAGKLPPGKIQALILIMKQIILGI